MGFNYCKAVSAVSKIDKKAGSRIGPADDCSLHGGFRNGKEEKSREEVKGQEEKVTPQYALTVEEPSPLWCDGFSLSSSQLTVPVAKQCLRIRTRSFLRLCIRAGR
jgi:hypothetical protein